MIVIVCPLAAAPAARALSSAPPDIQQVATDVANGTATATENEAYQSYVDWMESEVGVSADQLSFPDVEQADGSQVAWQNDPDVQALEDAVNSSPAGGSIEQAVGGEMEDAASNQLSLIPDAGAELVGDAVCASTVGCAVAVVGTLAVVAAIKYGPNVIDMLAGNDQQVNNATSGQCESFVSGAKVCGLQVPSQEVKEWCSLVPDPYNTSYDAINPGSWSSSGNGGAKDCLIPGGGGWPNFLGGAQDQNNGSNPCDLSVPCVPANRVSTTNPGAWFLLEQWPNGSWSFGSGGFAAPGSDISQCEGYTSNYYSFAWTPPPPGGPGSSSRWQQVALPNTNTGCMVGEGQYANPAPSWDYGYSYELGKGPHYTFPRSGSLPSGVPTATASPSAPSSWCVTGTCVANLFSSGNYPNLQQFVNAALGVTNPNTGQPYVEPGTVAIPTPSGAVTSSQYQIDLSNAGFTDVQVETLSAPQADWGTPAGDVVYTSPAVGTPVDTGSQVDVYVNPDPMPDPTQTGDHDDSSCDRSTPDYVSESDQNPSGFTVVSDPSLVQSSTFNTSLGPTVLNYGYASLINTDPLDFGGWGYWHILAGHGWSTEDDADTRTALETTPVPNQAANATTDSYVFYGPKYTGSGDTECRRVVVVDFGTASGDPGPKGIITSYGADVKTLSAPYQ